MADLRPIANGSFERPAAVPNAPPAVLWQRRALLHMHASLLDARGIDVTHDAACLYPYAAERALLRQTQVAAPEADGNGRRPAAAVATSRVGKRASNGEASGGHEGSAVQPPGSLDPLVDESTVTPELAYVLDPCDEIIVGKYVPGAELLPPKGSQVAAGRAKEGEPGSGMSAAAVARAQAAAKAYSAALKRRGAAGSSAVRPTPGGKVVVPRRPNAPAGAGSGARSGAAAAAGGSAAREVARAAQRGAGDDTKGYTGDSDDDDDADADADDDGAGVARDCVPRAPQPAETVTAERLDGDTLDVTCIASIFDGVPHHPSASGLLFPVAYPPPSKKDLSKRGPPPVINAVVHAHWPANAPLPPQQQIQLASPSPDGDSAAAATGGAAPTPARLPPPPGSSMSGDVPHWLARARSSPAAATATCSRELPAPRLGVMRLKRHNTNLIPLYRVGPGSVAFRVVTQALEASGAVYTPGGVFDYHVPRLVADDAADAFDLPPRAAERPLSVGWYVPPQAGTSSTAASFNVLWAKRADATVHGWMNRYQRVNHFPGSWGIGRKDNLHKNIARMRSLVSAAEFDIAPRTFLCPQEAVFLEADADDYRKKHGAEPTYIVKPVASSCGKGIRIVKGVPKSLRPTNTTGGGDRPPSAAEAVAESAAGSKSFVVQHYLPPFLVDGRKFDLRMYVTLASVDPLRIYLFDQGLVRFAAERYPGADALLENTWAHLTNYAVNKTAQLRKESAHLDAGETDAPVDIKWMISDLRDHFLTTTRDPVPSPTADDMQRANAATNNRPTLRDVRAAQWNRVMRECKDVIIKTILSVEAEIRAQARRQCRDPTGRGCFEMFGFDLMLDSQLKPHVIEVNIQASLATAENVDKAVKGRMLAHLTTMLGVVPFDRAAERRAPTAPLYAGHVERYGDPMLGCVKYSQRFAARDADKLARLAVKAAKATAASVHGASPAAARDENNNSDDEASESYQSSVDAATEATLLGGARVRKAAPKDSELNRQLVDSDDDNARAVAPAAAAGRAPSGSPAGGNNKSPSSVPQHVVRKRTNEPLLRLATPALVSLLEAHRDEALRHARLDKTAPADATDGGWGRLSLDEVRMIIESEEELNRSGGFERIYPTKDTHRQYSHLFCEGLPRSNFVLASWEAAKVTIAAAASALAPTNDRHQRANHGASPIKLD